jgi:hypothetical protein
MTTNPARSKWRTTRSAAMAAMYSAASCFRLRPSNFRAKQSTREVARIGGRQIVVGHGSGGGYGGKCYARPLE